MKSVNVTHIIAPGYKVPLTVTAQLPAREVAATRLGDRERVVNEQNYSLG